MQAWRLHSSKAAECNNHGIVSAPRATSLSLTCFRGAGGWLRTALGSGVLEVDVVVTAKSNFFLGRFRQQGSWESCLTRVLTENCDLRLHGLACLPQASSSSALHSEATKVSLNHCWGSLTARQHGILFHNVLLITEWRRLEQKSRGFISFVGRQAMDRAVCFAAKVHLSFSSCFRQVDVDPAHLR